MKLFRTVVFLITLSLSVFPDLVRLVFSRFPWRVITLSAFILFFSAVCTIWLLSGTWGNTSFQRYQGNLTLQQPLALPHSKQLPILVTEAQKVPLSSTAQNTLAAWESYLVSQQETKPLHRDVLLNLGILAWKQSRFDDAKEYWYQAWRLDPTTPALKPFFAEFSQR